MLSNLGGIVPNNDRLASLKALRDRLAVDIDECESARDVAALSNRLMEVLAQIDELEAANPVKVKANPIDEVAKRRAARKSNTANRTRTAR